jgi:hypothetical protein
MELTPDQLVADLRRFITPSYPHIDIRVMPWDRDPTRMAIYFTDSQFALIYPYQRWHYLTHLLLKQGFKDDEFFEVFHVLMRQGGFCDCEILYNVAEQSRLKAEYGIARADGRDPYDPHVGA